MLIDEASLRTLPTVDLSADQHEQLRTLFARSWPDPDDAFSEDDWDHTFGGMHFIVEVDGIVLAHASVIERELHAGEHRLRTGYVEGVATLPEHRRRGAGTAVMTVAGRYIDQGFELGALGTHLFDFYGRLGWSPWPGSTGVRSDDVPTRTPEEDGFVLVRRTPQTPRDLDLDSILTCDPRPGDVW